MAEYTCDICNRKFDETEKKLTKDKYKCMLHCEKDLKSDYSIMFDTIFKNTISKTHVHNLLKLDKIHFPINWDANILKGYSNKEFSECIFHEKLVHTGQINTFINCSFEEYTVVFSNIGNKVNNLSFENCKFNKLYLKNTIFTEKIFRFTNENKFYDIGTINIDSCEFEKDFLIISQNEEEPVFTVKEINLNHSTFHKKVKVQFCDIEKGDFYNTKFKDLADFYQSKFNKVNFERTDFEGITVFSEAEFNCDVFFKYTKFLSTTIFRDTVIHKKLDLRDSIFGNESDAIFLDITSTSRKVTVDDKVEFIGEPKDIKVSNRETARLIKSFYDYSNNVIEGNRFYKLEMIEKEKEIKLFKQPFNWLVFKFHRVSSNHSQYWLLPIFWIFFISFFYVSVPSDHSFYEGIYHRINLGSALLDKMANYINPFSIITERGNLSFSDLIYRVTIAYLIYQFIVSVRQNTRRK